MAFTLIKTRSPFLIYIKLTSTILPYKCSSKPGYRYFFIFTRSAPSPGGTQTNFLNFESTTMTQFTITNEIQYYRDTQNNFTQMSFSDTSDPYGPPLAIILPWKGLDKIILQKIIEFYCEKGFDSLTVRLTTEQFLYPCVAGNAMNVVTDLLKYLNESHKHRPYVFHGFSIGAYIFGEILAQCSDHYETYRPMLNNLKGCLWDSPVDIFCVNPNVGRFFYPKNPIKRLCCDMSVKRHFKKHYHDSVVYWMRSRDNFCCPVIKIPYMFFLSQTDILSNPCALESVLEKLDCNGIPLFQKTWCDSEHGHHFEKYCYEYIHGMYMFLNLSNLYPDQCGKYHSSYANASLTNLRLRKATKESLSEFVDKK